MQRIIYSGLEYTSIIKLQGTRKKKIYIVYCKKLHSGVRWIPRPKYVAQITAGLTTVRSRRSKNKRMAFSSATLPLYTRRGGNTGSFSRTVVSGKFVTILRTFEISKGLLAVGERFGGERAGETVKARWKKRGLGLVFSPLSRGLFASG